MFIFFWFRLEIPLGKFDPKSQNCQFNLKFGTLTNSNTQNSVVMFTFSFFDWKYFFGDIWSKNLKLSIQTEIGYVDWFEFAEFNGCVHFYWFRLEIPFSGKFGPKNWNCRFQLKFRISLMWICRIQCDVQVFSFKLEIVYGKVWSEKQNCQFKLKFVRRIRVYRIQWWWSLFLFSTRKNLFW